MLTDRISHCDCGYSTTIFGFTRHQHDILGDLPETPALNSVGGLEFSFHPRINIRARKAFTTKNLTSVLTH